MKLYKEYSPLVSIILPTFNREVLLNRAIKSVLKQDFTNWELIVVDDGSTDNTFSLISRYQEQYHNIKYIRHTNRKLPLTMNTGILLAAGKYVTFLGSDDEYKPDHLSSRISFLDKNPEIQFLHGGVEIIGKPYVKDKNDLSRMIHIDDCVIGGTFFALKEIYTRFGGFDDVYYSEDSEFYEKIKGEVNIAKVNFPTYKYYRDTPDSIASTIT